MKTAPESGLIGFALFGNWFAARAKLSPVVVNAAYRLRNSDKFHDLGQGAKPDRTSND